MSTEHSSYAEFIIGKIEDSPRLTRLFYERTSPETFKQLLADGEVASCLKICLQIISDAVVYVLEMDNPDALRHSVH